MSSERVSIELAENGVAQVRLNRPDKMNALDPKMFEASSAAGVELRTMKGLRAVVLAGEGRSFCAGHGASRSQTGVPRRAGAG